MKNLIAVFLLFHQYEQVSKKMDKITEKNNHNLNPYYFVVSYANTRFATEVYTGGYNP